jgi:hypothetical protein
MDCRLKVDIRHVVLPHSEEVYGYHFNSSFFLLLHEMGYIEKIIEKLQPRPRIELGQVPQVAWEVIISPLE